MHIDRDLFDIIQGELKTREVTILLGPRQVGKTYILKWVKKKVDRKGISSTFFNLEDPRELMRFNQSNEKIYNMLINSGRIIFIDEFHYLKNASQLFKAIYDSRHRIKIFASGSSSVEIHKHLKESLAGRRVLIQVPPLLFSELKKKMGEKAYGYYLCFGGLPGPVNEPNRKARMQHLSDLIQAYLLKDIKGLIKEENIRAFNMLLYLLAQSQGSLISVDSLSREVGLTARSIQKYIDIMQHTYVLGRLSSYSRNLGNELKKSKKYYLYDIGIRNALLKDFRAFREREDGGCLLESAVYLNLSSQLMPNEELRFWRTRDGREVDFVFLRNRQPIPIEVKSKLHDFEIPDGIKSFLRRYPNIKQALVLNRSINGSVRYKKTNVIFAHWSQCRRLIEKL